MYIKEEKVPIAIMIKKFPLKVRPAFVTFLKLRKVANAYAYAKGVFDKLDSGNPIAVSAIYERFEDGAVKEMDTCQSFATDSDFGIFAVFIREYYNIGHYLDWIMNFDNSNLKKGEELDIEYEVEYGNIYCDHFGRTLPGTIFQSPKYLLDKEAEEWKETLTDKQKQYLEVLTRYQGPYA